jgi:Zn-dependent protease with chaperone function
VPRLEWAGFFLDGQSAVRRPAVIRLTRTGIHAEVDGADAVRWSYGEIRQTQGFHPGEPVRLERGYGITQSLVIPDPSFLDSVREVSGPYAVRFRRAGRRWPLVVLGAAMGAIVVMTVLYRWGIPAAADVLAARVPVSWEDRLGAAIVDRLAPTARRCSATAGQAALDKLLDRITAAEPSPYRFHIRVVDDATVNAFAAPGGHLVLFRGLLDRARTPEEVAGVIAHEAEHVLRRHATRAIIQRASTGVLVASVFGDVSGLIASAATLAYSREHEAEADAEGLRLLRAARLDPRGMIAFFETMIEEERRVPQAVRYLSTHPATADRIARLRALAVEGAAAPVDPALTEVEWRALRSICL